MATLDDIGLAEPSTITKKLAAAAVQRNSTTQYQELLSIADPDSTTALAIAKVTNAAPASTTWGLAVRIAGGPSSAADLLARVNQGIGNSSLGDRWLVSAANSSAADFSGVRLVDSSGTGFHSITNPLPISVTDSSNAVVLAGDSANSAIRVNVVAGAAAGSTIVSVSTGSVRVHQSTASDLQVTATPVAGSTWRTQPGSTLWASSAGFHFDSSGALQVTGATASTVVTVSRTVGNSSAADYMPVRLVDSSGTGFLTPGNEYTDASTYSSFAGPTITYDNSSNNTYRAVGLSTPLPVQLRPGGTTYNSTTKLITSTASTAIYAMVSSVAATRHKVYAYSITSTHTVPSTLHFMSSNGQSIWAVQFGSGSSGVTGANLSVSPPAYLFATETAAALNIMIENPSTATASTTVARIAVSYVSEA